MKVLDLGTGPGSVALVAARLVGPTDRVVGIDMNPSALENARARAQEAGLTQLEFIQGNLNDQPDLDADFDAMVGRLVLQYLPDPTTTLCWAVQHLRSGGIVAIEESHYAQPPLAVPPSVLVSRAFDWVVQGFKAGGADPFIGPQLYRIFLDAGLLPPTMQTWAGVTTPERPGAGVLGPLPGLVHTIRRLEIATETELDIDRLTEEFEAERGREGTLVVAQGRMQAWSRKP